MPTRYKQIVSLFFPRLRSPRTWAAPVAAVAVLLTFAVSLSAQTIPHVIGTFKTPGNQTPAQAGLRTLATIGATPVYGSIDFVPTDTAANRPTRLLYFGVTYPPQPVRAWIKSDGTLVDDYTAATGVDLVPTIGATPSGLAMCATIRLAASADGFTPAAAWTECKQLPASASVDWGSLAVSTITTPSQSYQTSNGGTVNDYENLLGITAPANPSSGYARVWFDQNSSLLQCKTSSGTNCNPAGAAAFSTLGGGTNLTAAMVVGTGSSLNFTGSGTLNASAVNGVIFSNSESLGKIPIGQGNGTAVWSDPLVQGTYAPGTNVSTGGLSGGPINPVMIGGSDYAGTPALRNIKVDSTGQIYLGNASIAVTGTFFQGTQPVSGTVAATQSGNWTSRIVGNAGATLDSTVGAGAAPTNQQVVGALYNSTEISPTTGQAFALQADSKGRLRNVIMDAAGNTRGANVSAGNALLVDASATTQPVSGTVAATQSGTWTVQPGNTANTTPWLFDLRNLGGNAVVTGGVNGSLGVGGLAASGASKSGNPLQVGGVFNTAQPTVTTGQMVELQMTNRGEQLIAKGVSGFSIDNTGFNVNNTPAVTQSGTWTVQPGNTANTTPWLFDLRNVGGNAVVTGGVNGSQGVGGLAASGASKSGNPLQIGGVFNTTQPTVTTGQMVELQATNRGEQLIAKGVSGFSIDNTTFAATQSGTWVTRLQDGSGNAISSTSTNLNVQCANCSGSGVSAVDEAAFTAASSVFAPAGGFFQTTATSNALTTGQQGMAQMTAQRALFTNLRNASGTEMGTAANPLQISLANTGANSTAVKVDGSAVTQPVSGTVAATQSGNWTARIVGNAGATLDSTVGAGTAPTNQQVVGALYNSTEISPTTGQAFALQADSKGRLRNVIMDAAGNTRGANVTAANALVVDGSGVTQPISGTVTVTGCCGITDNTAYTFGSGSINVFGGIAQSGTPAAVSAGQAVSAVMDLNRRLEITCPDGTCSGGGGGGGIIQVKDATNTSQNVGFGFGNLSFPVQEQQAGAILAATLKGNLGQLAGVNLGRPSVYGQNPGLVNVLGVNAFVTNLPALNLNAVNGVNFTGQVAGSLPVTIVSGAGSGGTAVADNATYTEGSTSFTPAGCEFSGGSLTAGHAGSFQCTVDRNLFVNINKIGGTAPTTPGFLDIKGADGNVFVRQTTAANLNATVVGTGTFAVQATDNVTQFGGVNLSTGTGASGTGIPRVTVANDSNILSTQSGTWNVRNQDGAGNALTTNSTTYTAKFALDSNLLGTLGTAFTTPGFVDIKGADGNVFVRQATAANLNATVVGTGTFSVQAAQSGNWTDRIVGNAGGALDFAGQNAASPANALLAGCQFNTAPTTISSGNASPFQCTAGGALLVSGSAGGGVAQTQVQNTLGTYTCVGYASGCMNVPVQEQNSGAIIGAITNLIQTVKTDRVIGALGQPIGSVGDALKTYNVSTDPCGWMPKTDFAISQTAITRLIPAGPFPIHVCKLRVDVGTAEITSVVDGTGTNCGTSQVAHSGSTTANQGESFATNGGFQEGGAGVTVYTIPSGKDFCILESGANRVSGTGQFVYAP